MKILSLDASDAGACARTAQMILQYHRPVPFGLPDENLNISVEDGGLDVSFVDSTEDRWTSVATGGLELNGRIQFKNPFSTVEMPFQR